MTDVLRVFSKVPIPVEYASTQTYALLAKRDGGKTYTTLRFEEALCDAGLFFVTLDPVGKHWALRAGADGSERGGKRDVWVLGGIHGDVPLEASAGALIADVVIDHPGRYVLDLSGFDTEDEQDRFATDFAERLYRRKMQTPGFPLTVILEEAETFIPETPRRGQQRMLRAYARIMRQGRNHGLGMWLVAQRAQTLNKGVLSQAEVLIAKQMAHPRDLDAVDAWVKANGTPEQRDEMIGSLASLPQDEAYVWSPSWLRTFTRTPVVARVTYDSSASVKGGQSAQAVALVPLDVAALGEAILRTAERARSDDPDELRHRIRVLEEQLAQRDRELAGALGELVGLVDTVAAVRLRVLGTEAPPLQPEPAAAAADGAAPVNAPSRREQEDSATGMPFAVSNSQQRVLDALAWLEAVGFAEPTKVQAGLIAGYRVSKRVGGTFGNVLGELRGAGLVSYPRPSHVALEPAGRAIAQTVEIEPTAAGLQEAIYARLSAPERRVLQAIVAAYPAGIEKQRAGELAGYTVGARVGGTFGNILGRLRTLGLITYPTPRNVAASEMLFLPG